MASDSFECSAAVHSTTKSIAAEPRVLFKGLQFKCLSFGYVFLWWEPVFCARLMVADYMFTLMVLMLTELSRCVSLNFGTWRTKSRTRWARKIARNRESNGKNWVCFCPNGIGESENKRLFCSHFAISLSIGFYLHLFDRRILKWCTLCARFR